MKSFQELSSIVIEYFTFRGLTDPDAISACKFFCTEVAELMSADMQAGWVRNNPLADPLEGFKDELGDCLMMLVKTAEKTDRGHVIDAAITSDLWTDYFKGVESASNLVCDLFVSAAFSLDSINSNYLSFDEALEDCMFNLLKIAVVTEEDLTQCMLNKLSKKGFKLPTEKNYILGEK